MTENGKREAMFPVPSRRSMVALSRCVACALTSGGQSQSTPTEPPGQVSRPPVPLKGHPLPSPTGLQCSIKKIPLCRFHPSTISIIQHPSSHPSRASPSHPYAGPVIR